MKVRIEFPFDSQFEFPDPGTSSRELRTIALQNHLAAMGLDLSNPIDDYHVVAFNGEDNGEFWRVEVQRN